MLCGRVRFRSRDWVLLYGSLRQRLVLLQEAGTDGIDPAAVDAASAPVPGKRLCRSEREPYGTARVWIAVVGPLHVAGGCTRRRFILGVVLVRLQDEHNVVVVVVAIRRQPIGGVEADVDVAGDARFCCTLTDTASGWMLADAPTEPATVSARTLRMRK